MQKLMIAAVAILLTGVFGVFQVTGSDAQDARNRVRTVERDEVVIQTNGEDEEFEIIRGEDGRWQARRVVERPAEPQPGIFQRLVGPELQDVQVYRPMGAQQPGTWQIVSNDDDMILLNTATGATFMLDDNDDGMFWREIPRRGSDRRAMPEMPAMPEWRSQRDQPNRTPEQLKRRLNEMRKRMKETRGDAREKMERAIEELERALEKAGDARREAPKRENEEADRERRADELEAQIDELKEHIKDLSNEAEETDSRRHARELEAEIKEIKELIGNLKKELKELRD